MLRLKVLDVEITVDAATSDVCGRISYIGDQGQIDYIKANARTIHGLAIGETTFPTDMVTAIQTLKLPCQIEEGQELLMPARNKPGIIY